METWVLRSSRVIYRSNFEYRRRTYGNTTNALRAENFHEILSKEGEKKVENRWIFGKIFGNNKDERRWLGKILVTLNGARSEKRFRSTSYGMK